MKPGTGPLSKAAGTVPARCLVDSVPHRSTGGASIPGLTLGVVEHESSLERHALATLALCHDVLAMESQPGECYEFDGTLHTYHPDYALLMASGQRVRVEAKSPACLVREKALAHYLPMARWFRANGQPFVFLTDAQIEARPRFDSVRLLCRYLAGTLPDSVLPRIQEKLQTGPRPLAELAAPEAGLPLVALYTLLARRHLCFDWNAPLDIRATVSLPGQPYGGLHLADVLHSTRYGHLLAELALGRRPADQSVLAAAAAWRPRRRDLTPFNFVGGHGGQAPLRDLGQGECLPGTPWRRRDHAPGGATPQSGRGR